MVNQTSHRPGSTEKVDVLAERYAKGIDLWNPDDANWEGAVGAPWVRDSYGKDLHKKPSVVWPALAGEDLGDLTEEDDE